MLDLNPGGICQRAPPEALRVPFWEPSPNAPYQLARLRQGATPIDCGLCRDNTVCGRRAMTPRSSPKTCPFAPVRVVSVPERTTAPKGLDTAPMGPCVEDNQTAPQKLVEKAGFEPAVSSVRGRRERPDFSISRRLKLADPEGFEPSPSSLTVRCPTVRPQASRKFFDVVLTDSRARCAPGSDRASPLYEWARFENWRG